MDQTKQTQPLQKLSHWQKNELLKKLAQLIVSIYVVTFFFSCESLIHFLHTYSFKLQLYITFYFQQLFSHTFDRKHIFIICNGIVLFLGLYTSKSSSSNSDQCPTDAHQSNSLQLVSYQDPSPGGGFLAGKISSSKDVDREEEGVHAQDKFTITIVEDKKGSELFPIRDETDNILEIIEDKKELVNQDLEKRLSHEELDRMYDDFIRRMKTDIQSENLQGQLISYN